MNIALIKRMMDACYQAKRVRDLLPALPDGVLPSFIQYLDAIQTLEQQGIQVKVSDLSDALSLPRPGVTRTVKDMEARGLLAKHTSPEDGRVTYLTITEAGRALSRKYDAEYFSSLVPALEVIPEEDAETMIRTIEIFIRSWSKGEIPLKNDKTDFTQGSILKKLALFMLPILGALVLQAAYGAVDLLVVGRFGSTSGLSAVSTGSQVLNLVTFVVAAGHGCHSADRTVSRRKETRIRQPGHRRRGGCIRPSGRCAVRGSGVSGTAHFQPDAGPGRGP